MAIDFNQSLQDNVAKWSRRDFAAGISRNPGWNADFSHAVLRRGLGVGMTDHHFSDAGTLYRMRTQGEAQNQIYNELMFSPGSAQAIEADLGIRSRMGDLAGGAGGVNTYLRNLHGSRGGSGRDLGQTINREFTLGGAIRHYAQGRGATDVGIGLSTGSQFSFDGGYAESGDAEGFQYGEDDIAYVTNLSLKFGSHEFNFDGTQEELGHLVTLQSALDFENILSRDAKIFGDQDVKVESVKDGKVKFDDKTQANIDAQKEDARKVIEAYQSAIAQRKSNLKAIHIANLAERRFR